MQSPWTALRQACSALGTHDHRIVAYHEAAHIVVGEHFGKRLVEVCLDDTPGRPGYCRMEWGESIQADQRRSRDMVICMAGPVMDQELVGKIDADDTDFKQVRAALIILEVPKSEFPALLPRLLAEAKRIVQDRIEEVVEVANLLIENKTLSRAELLAKSKVPLFQKQ